MMPSSSPSRPEGCAAASRKGTITGYDKGREAVERLNGIASVKLEELDEDFLAPEV